MCNSPSFTFHITNVNLVNKGKSIICLYLFCVFVSNFKMDYNITNIFLMNDRFFMICFVTVVTFCACRC